MKKFFEEPTLEVLKLQEMESITDDTNLGDLLGGESGVDPNWP